RLCRAPLVDSRSSDRAGAREARRVIRRTVARMRKSKIETVPRRYFPSVYADQWGSHASVVFPVAPLLAPACRLPPSPPPGIPRECATPLAHVRSRSPPSRAPRGLVENLVARNFPRTLQYHRNG